MAKGHKNKMIDNGDNSFSSPYTDTDSSLFPSPFDDDPYTGESPLSDPTDEDLQFFDDMFQYAEHGPSFEGSSSSLVYIPPDLGAAETSTTTTSTTTTGHKTKKSPRRSPKSESVPGVVLFTTPGWALKISTKFHSKYWRNDRKNLQCFPFCPEYGDYHVVRVNNLKHSQTGTCKTSVDATLSAPTNITPASVLVMLRVSIVDAKGLPSSELNKFVPDSSGSVYLSKTQMLEMRETSFVGKLCGTGGKFHVKVAGDRWKVNMELSKKRRPAKDSSKVPRYCVELVVLLATGNNSQYQLVYRGRSSLFEIASTRTLLRDLKSKTEAKPSKAKTQDAAKKATKRIAETRAKTETSGRRKQVKMEPSALLPPEQQPFGGADNLFNDEQLLDWATSDEFLGTNHTIHNVNVGDAPVQVKVEATEDSTLTHRERMIKQAEQNVTEATIAASLVGESPHVMNDRESTHAHPPPPPPASHSASTGSHKSTPSNATGTTAVTEEVAEGVPADDNWVRSQQIAISFKVLTVSDAYMYAIPPLGWVGAHHAYLERPKWMAIYLCTFGLLGVGWWMDLFRISCLVKDHNEGKMKDVYYCEMLVVFMLTGWLGGHRFLIGDYVFGFLQLCTLGCFGTVYLWDGLQFNTLYSNYDNNVKDEGFVKKENVYMLAFPLGFFGLHHFYLGRHLSGLLYLCTFGLFGVGVVLDLFRVNELVETYNSNLRAKREAAKIMDQRYRQVAREGDVEMGNAHNATTGEVPIASPV